MIDKFILNKECLRRKNFVPDDFFVSETANNNHLINYPLKNDELAILSCLMLTADKIQQIRDLLNFSIKITSAYRSREVNMLIGGTANSQHIQGQAVDFICPKFGNPEKIVIFLREKQIVVDQCLIEATWVHLSIKHNGNRNQFGKLIDGKFTEL